MPPLNKTNEEWQRDYAQALNSLITTLLCAGVCFAIIGALIGVAIELLSPYLQARGGGLRGLFFGAIGGVVFGGLRWFIHRKPRQNAKDPPAESSGGSDVSLQ